MLFTLPGLIIWVGGLIWCIRKNNLLGSMMVQVVGALEVVVGAGAAFIFGMVDIADAILASRSFEPQMFIGDSKYVAKVSLCGLLIHLVMLLVTVTLVLFVKRRSKKQDRVGGWL